MPEEKVANFLYAISCLILSCIDYPKKDLEKHIGEASQKMKEGAWELKKTEEVKP